MSTEPNQHSHLVTDEPEYTTGLPEFGVPMPAIDEVHAIEPRAAGPYPPVPGQSPATLPSGQHLRDQQWSDGHDDANETTAVVDERSGGDATGGERDLRKRVNEQGLRKE